MSRPPLPATMVNSWRFLRSLRTFVKRRGMVPPSCNQAWPAGVMVPSVPLTMTLPTLSASPFQLGAGVSPRPKAAVRRERTPRETSMAEVDLDRWDR